MGDRLILFALNRASITSHFPLLSCLHISLMPRNLDASAIPLIPAGVHSTVVMLAATAAHLILAEAGLD